MPTNDLAIYSQSGSNIHRNRFPLPILTDSVAALGKPAPSGSGAPRAELPFSSGFGVVALGDSSTAIAQPQPDQRTARIVLRICDIEHVIDYRTETFVGRHPLCDIRIRSEYTSRVHARFVFREDGFHLVDVSKNGTFVKTSDGDIFHLKNNAHFPMAHSGFIGFGTPCAKAGDWIAHYSCKQD